MKKLKYYLLLVSLVILLFLGVFIIENIFKYLGFVDKLKFIARLWTVVVISYVWASQTTEKYRKQLLIVKMILLINTIIFTTFYGFALLYLDKLGYQVIPTSSIRQWAHGLVVIFIIFNINEQIISKMNRSIKRHSKKSNGI